MNVPVLIVISTFSLISIGNSCNVASWSYGSSSSYYDDYNSGPQMGFGFSPGFFGYTGGFGLGSLGLLMAMLMSRRHHPPPREVHHHHHHYYKEKPGGGFDYQYKNEGPKWEQGSYGPGNPSAGPEPRGPKRPGGSFDYQYRNEGPKWEQGSYGPGNPSSGPEPRGPKSGGPFSNFFRNMFYRR